MSVEASTVERMKNSIVLVSAESERCALYSLGEEMSGMEVYPHPSVLANLVSLYEERARSCGIPEGDIRTWIAEGKKLSRQQWVRENTRLSTQQIEEALRQRS